MCVGLNTESRSFHQVRMQIFWIVGFPPPYSANSCNLNYLTIILCLHLGPYHPPLSGVSCQKCFGPFAPGICWLVPPRHHRRPELLQGVIQHPNHRWHFKGLKQDSIEESGQFSLITQVNLNPKIHGAYPEPNDILTGALSEARTTLPESSSRP